MYELIDENNNIKMMALIICTFTYGGNPYCLYSIERDDKEDNIFVSKIVKNSMGYTLDSNIKSDEKEALDNVIADFLNRTSINDLQEQGFELSDFKLNGINKFNEKKCYVTTYDKNFLKECMLNYKLDIPNNKVIPVVKVKKIKPINKGNYENILLIILGIITIIVCILVIIKVSFK